MEAKANIGELRQSTGAKSKDFGGGLELIEERLAQTQKAMGLTEAKVWTKPYYQYANRLALLHFLQQQGVSAHLIFVYFNGDTNTGAICPANAAASVSYTHLDVYKRQILTAPPIRSDSKRIRYQRLTPI